MSFRVYPNRGHPPRPGRLTHHVEDTSLHTLTKIFIVLQALLSVFLLALVVPLAVNQDHWKSKYQTVKGDADQAAASLEAAKALHSAQNAENLEIVEGLKSQITDLQAQASMKDQNLIDVRSRLGDAELRAGEVRAQLDTLTATVNTQASIIETQGEEITERRNESLEIQKRAIELEDQLRDALTRLDVATDAVRILQEQLTRALKGEDEEPRPGTEPAPVASPNVIGHVLRVTEEPSGIRLAVIDLGSRDGLAENMRFLISRDKKFMGYLTLTTVDINRSIGRIDLEQPDKVRVSDDVYGGFQ